jgi:hypothetical protein
MSTSFRGATVKEIRSTGFVVGGAFGLLALAQVLFHGKLSRPPGICILSSASLLLLLLAWVAPATLRPFHWAWMKLAEAIGWVMNRVLLGITFFVLFTLTGLVVRLIGRDALHRDFRTRRESHWTPRRGEPPTPDRYERQF